MSSSTNHGISHVWKKLHDANKFEFPGYKAAHSAEVINNKIYLFGGWNGKRALNDLHIFDIEKEVWIEPEINGYKPGNRNNHATAVYNHYMFLHGGHNGEYWQDDFDILDTKELVWNKVNLTTEEAPLARACHTLNRVGKKLFMIGGYDGNKCYNDVDIYDIEKKYWTSVEGKGSVPSARNAHTVTTVEKKLYLFGGHSGNKHLSDLFILDTSTFVWTEVLYTGDSPIGLRGHTSNYVANHIVIFGGYDGKGRSNNIHILDLSNNEFYYYNNKDKAPSIRQRHSAVAVDNKKIYVFGGFDGSKWLNDIYILNFSLLLENILSDNFKIEFLSHIKQMKTNKSISDITFLLSDGESLGIKQILVNRSLFFREIFININKILKEQEEKLVLSKEISDDFKIIINLNFAFKSLLQEEHNLNSEDDKSVLSTCSKFSKVLDSDDCVFFKDYQIKEYFYNVCLVKKSSLNTSVNPDNTVLINLDCTVEHFDIILDYIYSASTEKVNNDSAKKIIHFAKLFNLDLLYKLCELRIIEKLDQDNIFEVLILAYSYNFTTLKDYLLDFLKLNFKEISKSSNFPMLEAFPQILMDIMMISLEYNNEE